MVKKLKQTRRRRNNDEMNFDHVCAALDLILAGHDSVIGPDFIVTGRDPYNADIGHLDPEDLRTYDQDFVDMLVGIKSKQPVPIPEDLKSLCQVYMKQRELLSDYHMKVMEDFFLIYDIDSAHELGNFDLYIDKIVLRNYAETNVFYDYMALYRKIGSKRAVIDWRLKNQYAMDKHNKAVVMALEKAKFAVLRLDKNLAHGGIRATNVITQDEYVLMDRALNGSHKEGCFFICSILDMGDYVMTTGGGIPIDPKSSGGKSALTLLKPHFDKLQTAQRAVNKDITACVREVYGFCLRSGALEYMTVQ